MGLFQRPSQDAGPTGATVDAGSGDADQVAATLDRLSHLPPPERAAEVLNAIAPAIDKLDDYLGMQELLKPWLPDSGWMKWSPDQRHTWFSLELVLQEAFQVLVLTRMLIRRESPDRFGTTVTYALGPDARDAQSAGNVPAVVARRLPD